MKIQQNPNAILDLIQSIRRRKDSRNTHFFRRHSVAGITMAETSPARLQSRFGSLCVYFGSKLHWDLCSGHSPLPPTIQLEHQKLDQHMNLLHHPPKTSAVQGYLNVLHHSPFGVWRSAVWDPSSRRAHCYETQGSHLVQEPEAPRQIVQRDPVLLWNKFKLCSNNAPYWT